MAFNKYIKLILIILFLSSLLLCGRNEIPEPKFIIDLSPAMGEDFILKTWGERAGKNMRSFKFDHFVSEEPYYITSSYLTIFNHIGSHFDPPNHIIKGAKSVDQIPLEKFFGKANIFDFRGKTPGEPLLKEDFEDKNIKPGEIVIVYAGYSPPTDPEKLPSYPFLSGEAAEYLAEIPVKAFATDMLSIVDYKKYYETVPEGIKGSENVFPEHYAFLSREIPVIEGLVNLEKILWQENVVFSAFPINIKGGNGSPVRAAAIIY